MQTEHIAEDAGRAPPTLTVKPLHPALGAEVGCIDLSQTLDDATFRAIESAWHAHGVLLFRNQSFDDLQQVAFAARFGELATTLKAYEGAKVHPARNECFVFVGETSTQATLEHEIEHCRGMYHPSFARAY